MSFQRDATGIAYQIQGMLRTCICAEDTAINVDKMFGGSDGIYLVLEVAEAMMGDLIDRIEKLEYAAKDYSQNFSDNTCKSE